MSYDVLRYNTLTVFILIFALCSSALNDCDQPLLEMLNNGPPMERDNLIMNSGAPYQNLTTKIPLLDSDRYWKLRYGGSKSSFTTPLFMLHKEAPMSPHFWITGVAIQNGGIGSCGYLAAAQGNSLNSYMREIIVTVGVGENVSTYTPIHAPYTQRNEGNNPVLNLEQLGMNNRGRVLKFNFQPVAADAIRLQLISAQPVEKTLFSQEICLRVEIYGCKRDGPMGFKDEPDINKGVLLQYITPTPDVRAYEGNYIDDSYNGKDSKGLLSGGTGELTDNSIERNPLISEKEFLGWSICSTKQPYVLFLFNSEVDIKRIILNSWRDVEIQAGDPSLTLKAYDQFNNEIKFDGKSGRKVTFLRVTFDYPGESMIIMLSEISLVNSTGFDITSGVDRSALLFASRIDQNTTTTTTLPTPTNPGREIESQCLVNDQTFVAVIVTLIILVMILIAAIIFLLMLITILYKSSREKLESHFYSQNDKYGMKDEAITIPYITSAHINSNTIRDEEKKLTMESLTGERSTELSESQIYL